MQTAREAIRATLTDLYQITMAYGYWKSGHKNDEAVFDLFFRKNPFGGEFTIFAGLEDAQLFLEQFRFNDEDIAYLQEILPKCDRGFFEWLRSIDCSKIKVWGMDEGTIAFPRVPLLRAEGPLATAQLLETGLLNCVNYASLVTTNAARYRLAAGTKPTLLEFGLRRAQGRDGGLSASRYAYLGGFDGTSNVLAGMKFGIPVRGTMAHSFVQTFSDLKDLSETTILNPNGEKVEFVETVLRARRELGFENSNAGELAAFIAYAQAFPDGFLALVDSYDTLGSGVPNFICVALALHSVGYRALGIRIDSGDLPYLSGLSRVMLSSAGKTYNAPLQDSIILVSNDINEEKLLSFNEHGQQGTAIDGYGIGTHLVTCERQPALGCVYKLVEVNGVSRIKATGGKVVIPGKKVAYRLFGESRYPILDLMTHPDEPMPRRGVRVFCRDPFEETKRAYVVPSKVKNLHSCVWDGKVAKRPIPLSLQRAYVISQLDEMRPDHLRFINPTPCKVSVSERIYRELHHKLLSEIPIPEMK